MMVKDQASIAHGIGTVIRNIANPFMEMGELSENCHALYK